MIIVHRLSGIPLFVNPDLIMYLESSPDTVITFRGGEKLPVKETINELQIRILDYRRSFSAATEFGAHPPPQD
ncbi:MAG: flagellar FlbD family protein [Bdellovibrionaceae bacterium]|nr:flagellar FlbD family protein [Bdellovibrionales bacterium]MCB9085314.1 flagellar FlbD family protein [Pseudobdellovibrionaceae bacterium]